MTYVVWLHNNTNRQDDEWIKVTASNKKEAIKRAAYSPKVGMKFSIGTVYTVREFEKEHGKGLLE